jgi:di/tripeptidase
VTRPADYPVEPAHLFEHFYRITQIPRPSGAEKAVRDYVIGLADEREMQWRRDARGNVAIEVPGSAGREEEPIVIVQNHLDMVTVKTDDKTHDFTADPLALWVEDGWLLADRTTLGADNGIGCAAALALMTDEELSHPPLEQWLLVFPHGAVSYNAEQPADLVDLSINLAVVRVDDEGLFLESTLRYFNADEAKGLAQQVRAIAEWQGCSVEDTIDYPGRQPEFDNPLLELARDSYRELFGADPAVKAIHAGLECGILKSKKPELDVVSFGPTIRGAHSPRERLEIATVEPFWHLLLLVLERTRTL